MTDPAADSPVSPTPTPEADADGWDALLAALRRRYPGQKDSVLFCVHKLSQDAELTLRDFREEARLHGIPMAGRALHSARVLLGLAPANKPATANPAPVATPLTETGPVQRVRRRRSPEPGDTARARSKHRCCTPSTASAPLPTRSPNSCGEPCAKRLRSCSRRWTVSADVRRRRTAGG